MENKKYSKLRAAFEATQPKVPDDFTKRVMKRIEKRAPIQQSNRRTLRWSAAAACILLITGIGMFQNMPLDSSLNRGSLRHQAGAKKTLMRAENENPEGVTVCSATPSGVSREGISPTKPTPQTRAKKFRTRNTHPDTLGNGIWQRRENVETALRILSECEADIERSEQQVCNHIIEATFRATPQPANVILVSDENGDYEVVETKRIINI